MDLPRSKAETKSAARARGQAQQPKGSQILLPIYCFISNMFADLEKRGGVGQGGDSWVPTSLPLVEADTCLLYPSPPPSNSFVTALSRQNGVPGSPTLYLQCVVCLLSTCGNLARCLERRGHACKHGLFWIVTRMPSLTSYQIVGTRQPSGRVRDLEPTSYKSGQP